MSRFAYYAIPLVLSLNACQTSEPDKGASTGKTVDQAAAEVGATITNLDATVAALNELVERPAPDLNPQFKTYTTNLGMLETSAGKVRDLAATMDTKSQEYFLQWDTQIATVQDEDIRERSEDRKKTIEANFNKIKNEYAEVRNEFKPLLADLQDIRTVLTTDLTVDGLKSINKTVKKVDDESKDVKESLQEMEKRFHDLGVKLSRTGPAPAPPKQ
jgi:chromosome segregation ATPase